MTVHARRIASIPRRGPIDTWRVICDMLCEQDNDARPELDGIAGIASAMIAEEYTRDAPIIISGVGPQVRIYTLHGDQAVEADISDELPLNHGPTTGSWTMSLPCAEDDLDEARDAVRRAPHVEVRQLGDDTSETAIVSADTSSASRPVIDLTALEQL